LLDQVARRRLKAMRRGFHRQLFRLQKKRAQRVEYSARRFRHQAVATAG
jgi:hypothetical protein